MKNNQQIATCIANLAAVVRVQNGNKHDDINAMLEDATQCSHSLVSRDAGLDFSIVKRGDIYVLVYDGQGCRPANDNEVAMWTLMFGEPKED